MQPKYAISEDFQLDMIMKSVYLHFNINMNNWIMHIFSNTTKNTHPLHDILHQGSPLHDILHQGAILVTLVCTVNSSLNSKP